MSASEFFSDVLHGNLTHAYQRLSDWYSGWPPALKAFVTKLTDDEGQIIWTAAQAALVGLESDKSITVIGDEVWEAIKEQVPSKGKADVLDALGVLLRASTPATVM